MSMIGKLRAIRMLTAVAFLASSAFAQNNGSITGTVKDHSGAVVAGASVTATDREVGVAQTTVSNAEGNFIFPQLPPGTYKVTVELKGFKKAEKSEITLPTASKVSVGDII